MRKSPSFPRVRSKKRLSGVDVDEFGMTELPSKSASLYFTHLPPTLILYSVKN